MFKFYFYIKSNIFEKLYRDAELRRKFVRRNSEKNYRVNEESLYNNSDLSSKKSSKNLLSHLTRERLINKSDNFVFKKSEKKIIPNEHYNFVPKIKNNNISEKRRVNIAYYLG